MPMDSISLRRINLLHPKIRQEVLDAYKRVNNNLGAFVQVRISQTLRTYEEQEQLYSQGRSILVGKNGNRLKKVTNAMAGQSIHNYGLAFDIVLLIDKDRNDSFESVAWDIKADYDSDSKADWIEAATHFKSIGYNWGGDWKSFPDYPHFEKTYGHTWRTLQQKYRNGDTFTELIDGKIYNWVKL